MLASKRKSDLKFRRDLCNTQLDGVVAVNPYFVISEK